MCTWLCHSTNAAGYIWSLSLGTAASKKRGPEVPNRRAEILDADCDFTGPIFHGFGTKFNVLDEMQVTGIKLFCHL